MIQKLRRLTPMQREAIYKALFRENVKGYLRPRKFNFSAFPNPFNSDVSFEFALPEDSPVSIGIYDLSGRRVSFVKNDFKVGVHRLKWNGRGEGNEELSSGIYFYKIETKSTMKILRGVYLK